MIDERELREKVARTIRGEPSDPALAWDALSDVQKQPWINDADRAIALCREHYEGEIERLRRERDEYRVRAEMFEIKLRRRLSFREAEEIITQLRLNEPEDDR